MKHKDIWSVVVFLISTLKVMQRLYFHVAHVPTNLVSLTSIKVGDGMSSCSIRARLRDCVLKAALMQTKLSCYKSICAW